MWTYVLVIYFWSGPPALPEMGDFPNCQSAKKYYQSIYWQDKQVKELQCEYSYIEKKSSKS